MRNPWCEMFQAYAPASPNATRSPARSRLTRTRRASTSLGVHSCPGDRHGLPGHAGPRPRRRPLRHRQHREWLVVALGRGRAQVVSAQSQPLRQTAQPALWSEATIRQPAGASGHPAWAGCPVGHPASTTVVPGGSGW